MPVGRRFWRPFCIFDDQGMSDEADLSAEQSGACTPPRLPRADGNGGRSQRPSCAPRTRSQEAFGIITGNSPALVVRAEVLVRAEVALGTKVALLPEVSGAAILGLKIRRDFLAANAGKRAPMPGFVLFARDRADGVTDMRIGFTVTKKIGNENEKIKQLVNCIDEQLYANYKLWPVNYIANDIANESKEFSSHYTEEEKNNFINYIKQKTSKLKGDEQSLFNLFINMYANPVKTKKLSPVSN